MASVWPSACMSAAAKADGTKATAATAAATTAGAQRRSKVMRTPSPRRARRPMGLAGVPRVWAAVLGVRRRHLPVHLRALRDAAGRARRDQHAVEAEAGCAG